MIVHSENLDLYVRGELDADMMRDVEDHVRTCALCTKELQSAAHMEVTLIELAHSMKVTRRTRRVPKFALFIPLAAALGVALASWPLFPEYRDSTHPTPLTKQAMGVDVATTTAHPCLMEMTEQIHNKNIDAPELIPRYEEPDAITANLLRL